MITNVWTKAQPNKKKRYPNSYPMLSWAVGSDEPAEVKIYSLETGKMEGTYRLADIARVEYRP